MEPPHIVLLCEWGLQETVHSSRVSSANLECRQLNDPIFSQQPGQEGTLVFFFVFFSAAPPPFPMDGGDPSAFTQHPQVKATARVQEEERGGQGSGEGKGQEAESSPRCAVEDGRRGAGFERPGLFGHFRTPVIRQRQAVSVSTALHSARVT